MANNLCTSSMILHKITPSLDYNWRLKKVSTLISMNLSTTIFKKSPKLWSQRIRKRYDKILGTSVINSPMTLPSLPAYDRKVYLSSPRNNSFSRLDFVCLFIFLVFHSKVAKLLYSSLCLSVSR